MPDGRVLACEVLDISATGAQLAVASVLGIPPVFQLETTTGQIHTAEVVRRAAGRIGVRFLR